MTRGATPLICVIALFGVSAKESANRAAYGWDERRVPPVRPFSALRRNRLDKLKLVAHTSACVADDVATTSFQLEDEG